MPGPTHECPGCGRDGVSRHMFACRACWYALPVELRHRIQHGWRHSASEHVAATAEARAFYRAEQPGAEL